MDRKGHRVLASEHVGCPVLKGSKWILNKWIYSFDQFKYVNICHLNKAFKNELSFLQEFPLRPEPRATHRPIRRHLPKQLRKEIPEDTDENLNQKVGTKGEINLSFGRKCVILHT